VDNLSRVRPANAPAMCLDVAGGWATIATCSSSNTQAFRMNATAPVREYLQQQRDVLSSADTALHCNTWVSLGYMAAGSSSSPFQAMWG
jgi:hypothetical protein